LVDIEFFNVFL